MRSKGFTLIELLIAISILAIISTVAIVSYSQAQLSARDSRRKSDLRALQTALELYYQRNNQTYPTSSFTNLDSQLVPDFINKLPTDPSSPARNYSYSSDGITYVLCADLENDNDKDRVSPPACTSYPSSDFVIIP